MYCNDEAVTKILGKVSLEFPIFEEYSEQLKLKNILDTVLYQYNVVTKETSLVTSDIEEKLMMFIAAKKIDGMSRKTLKNYYDDISKLGSFTRKPVSTIDHNDIRMYLTTQCSHMKETSIATKIYSFKTFFQWLHDEEYIPRNIMNKIKAPKIPKRLREGLTHEELEILRMACVTDREKALLEFFASTGCRLSEACALKIEDIDFHDNSFKVIGKGNKERMCLFTPKAKLLLKKYINNRKAKSIYLFCSSRHPYGPLSKRVIEQDIQNIRKRAGFDKPIFPHLIRHTYCTHKANSGMSMTVLQSLMGHDSLATTERYFKISDDIIKSEYKKLSN